MDTVLFRVSWVLYAGSLLLPAARSTTLNASRATYGCEIVLGFPLIIINPFSLTHPVIWAYVTALFARNLVVLLSSRFRQQLLQGRVPAGLAKGLVLAMVCAASVATGIPRIVGVDVERLLAGYYCWVMSIVISIVALLWTERSVTARAI